MHLDSLHEYESTSAACTAHYEGDTIGRSDLVHQALRVTRELQGYLSGGQLLIPGSASQVPHNDQLSQSDKLVGMH